MTAPSSHTQVNLLNIVDLDFTKKFIVLVGEKEILLEDVGGCFVRYRESHRASTSLLCLTKGAHPASERAVVRLLGRVGQKSQVILITQSDWIVRELNNCIMLHTTQFEGTGVLHEEHGYTKEMAINPADVCVYEATPAGFRPVGMTDFGFEITSLNQEMKAMNVVPQHLYSRWEELNERRALEKA